MMKWPGNKIGEYTDDVVRNCYNRVECSFCGKDLKAGYHTWDNFVIPVFACDECIESYREWRQFGQ